MILPGATIGILGGGQLGRLTAMAARSLGYGVSVLDPDPNCAARAVADGVIVANFDDPDAARELAKGSAVVTYEIEKIALPAAEAAAKLVPVRPSLELLAMVQDRWLQKSWLSDHGFPVGPFAEASNAEQVAAAVARWGGAGLLKARRGGYDGRGQARAGTPAEAAAAWQRLGGVPCIVERELTLAAELSVLVARRASGEVALFPPAQNWHSEGILAFSALPGQLPPALARRAQEVARQLAVQLELEGLLAVEFFETDSGELLVNELAPRPHNTFHATETACLTSQFEQLVRAICDLPLGSTDLLRPTALANLLGDLWLGSSPPDLARALALPGVRIHLYGKSPRRGRKMGHLLAMASTAPEALALVRRAKECLSYP